MNEGEIPSEGGAPAGVPAYGMPAEAPQLRRQSVGIRLVAEVIDSGYSASSLGY